MPKKAVILDTDIGNDIDDTWALVYLLKLSQLDAKFIITNTGNTIQKAKIVAKMLKIANRTDIPVGIGVQRAKNSSNPNRQERWIKDFYLSDYQGMVEERGIDKLIEIMMSTDEEITIIAIGPLTNIGAALEKEPRVAERAHFIGMQGSIYRGYGGSEKPSAEYNVIKDIPAARKVFSAPWKSITIAPLDTCGLVRLKGDLFESVREMRCSDPIINALMENYMIWKYRRCISWIFNRRKQLKQSSILFDTVAIYLAYSDELLRMENVPIIINDDGIMEIKRGKRESQNLEKDSQSLPKNIRCATRWKDLNAFKRLLVETLIQEKDGKK